MSIRPRSLLNIAGISIALPAVIMFTSQVIIWLIPGCSPGAYGAEGCVVAGYETAPYLVVGSVGGMFLTAAAAAFVALPLLTAASIWSLFRYKSRARHT